MKMRNLLMEVWVNEPALFGLHWRRLWGCFACFLYDRYVLFCVLPFDVRFKIFFVLLIRHHMEVISVTFSPLVNLQMTNLVV